MRSWNLKGRWKLKFHLKCLWFNPSTCLRCCQIFPRSNSIWYSIQHNTQCIQLFLKFIHSLPVSGRGIIAQWGTRFYASSSIKCTQYDFRSRNNGRKRVLAREILSENAWPDITVSWWLPPPVRMCYLSKQLFKNSKLVLCGIVTDVWVLDDIGEFTVWTRKVPCTFRWSRSLLGIIWGYVDYLLVFGTFH